MHLCSYTPDIVSRKKESLMTTSSNALVQLQALRDALQRFEDGSITASALSDLARSSPSMLASLPERYGPVLLQLMDRLESSALFTEESCSFSQSDLLQHLHGWIDKAQTQLDAAP